MQAALKLRRPKVIVTLERIVILALLGLILYQTKNRPNTEILRPASTVVACEQKVESKLEIKPTTENGPFAICNTAVTRTMSAETIKNAIVERSKFYKTALPTLRAALNKEMARNGPLDVCKSLECKYTMSKGWMGLRHDHERWNMLGKPVLKCPTLRSFGYGDEEKRLCWSEELVQKDDCVVFSIGSNNLWAFEQGIVDATKCVVHTFDCTIGEAVVPANLRNRVHFHSACLGAKHHGERYHTLGQLAEMAGVKSISFLKMDIEGFEWDVIVDTIDGATSVLETTGKDIFPDQIAVELHYLTMFKENDWHGRDLSPGEIVLFMEYFFQSGGFVLADRRDNQFCPHCSEILLVRAKC